MIISSWNGTKKISERRLRTDGGEAANKVNVFRLIHLASTSLMMVHVWFKKVRTTKEKEKKKLFQGRQGKGELLIQDGNNKRLQARGSNEQPKKSKCKGTDSGNLHKDALFPEMEGKSQTGRRKQGLSRCKLRRSAPKTGLL